MNMTFKKQEMSRARPKRGDLFYAELSDGRIIVGLVVENEAKVPLIPAKLNLVYFAAKVYDDLARFEERDFAQLLIEPVITNNQLWLKGFVTTFAKGFPVDKFKRARHAFTFPNGHFDEFAAPVGKCDVSFQGGVASPVLIERRVTEAISSLNSTSP